MIINTEFCKGLISIGVCHTFSISYQEVRKRHRIYLIYLINIYSHSGKQFPIQTLCLNEYKHPIVILVFFWTESKFLTFQLCDGWAGGQDGTRDCVLPVPPWLDHGRYFSQPQGFSTVNWSKYNLPLPWRLWSITNKNNTIVNFV